MKTSFYFVLWQLIFILLAFLPIPGLDNYSFIIAIVLVIVISSALNKALSEQLRKEQVSDIARSFEMIYTNDVTGYRKILKRSAILETITFAYLACATLGLFFIPSSNLPFGELIIFAIITIGTGYSSFKAIGKYNQAAKADSLGVTEEALEDYNRFKEQRQYHLFDEFMPEKPSKGYRIATIIFAILSILSGLLFMGISVYGIIVGNSSNLMTMSYLLYGGLALFFGVKDVADNTTDVNVSVSGRIIAPEEA